MFATFDPTFWPDRRAPEPDAEHARLVRALFFARQAVRQGERDRVSGAAMLLLLSRVNDASQAERNHRSRFGLPLSELPRRTARGTD